MQKTYFIIVVIIILLVIAGAIYYYVQPPQDLTLQEVEADSTTALDEPEEIGEILETVETIEVTANNFAFSPAEITVKQGDKVKIVLNNIEGFHDLVIDEFNAKTPQVQGPKTVELEFVADKAGTFEYYCSVGNHRAMGMKGNLIVQ